MYAVVQLGSSQYKVSEGDTLQVPKLQEEVGKAVTFDKVLAFAKGSDVRIGQPLLKDVKVKAKVIDQTQGSKIVTLKYRRRKDSAQKTGNRSKLTTVNITNITVS